MSLPSKAPQLIAPEELDKALYEYWQKNPPTFDDKRRDVFNQLNMVAYFTAVGFSQPSIMKVMSISRAQLERCVLRPGFQELVQGLMINVVAQGPYERFRSLVDDAITKVQDVMMRGQKDSDILRACEMILERALGKVTQAVEVKADSPLRKLLEKISESNTIDLSRQSQDAPLELDFETGEAPTTAETKG